MMTKTTLSDGRRTRPRFAAPTPTPPKFLIATPRLEIAVSGRKTSKMQNPNRDKMGVFYPPPRLNGLQWYRPARRGGHSCLPRGTKGLCASAAPWIPRLPHTAASLPRTPRRNPASAMSRRFCSFVPIACPEGRRAESHPRKPSGLSQSLIFTPLAPIHPRKKLGARGRSAAKSKTPARCRRYKNPLAQSHPRKPLRLSRPLGCTPFAQPHPRNAVTPLPAAFSYRWLVLRCEGPPAGVFEVLSTSRPLFGLEPLVYPEGRRALIHRKLSGLSQSLVFTLFAQPHPRNAVTPLPAAFSYRWLVLRYEGPPAGVFEVLSTSRPLFGLEPLARPELRGAQPHSRKPLRINQSFDVTPLALIHPRKKTSGRGFRAFRVPTLPSGIPSVNDSQTSSLPFALLYPRNNASSWRMRLPRPAPPHRVDVSTIPRPSSGLVPIACPEVRRAQPHPREPLVLGVLQSNVGASYTSLPFAPLYPRNKQSGRARSAETSKTPARCRRYENPLLIVTPRLEIAATTSKSNTVQNSNRHKIRVLHPPWGMCVLPPPQTGALRRSANAAAAPHLKTLIANARLKFNLSHSKENPLQISNRERMTVPQSRFRAPAQEGRRITIRASKVNLRFELRYSSFQLRAPSLQNLIANLELEFRLTHTKLSPLRISNRKYFAVFHADLFPQGRNPEGPRRATAPS